MTRRTRQKILVVLIAVLALGILSSVAWIVWYDRTRGRAVSEISENTPEPYWGHPVRNIQADVSRVGRTVQPGGFLGTVLARFHRRAGRYPAGLSELFERPPDLSPSRWDGPYVSTNGVLNDPWDRPYQYRYPGVHNDKGYDLWSLGPDGVDGTKDDLGNW